MLVALMLLASCSKQQGQQLVPEDALFVMRIDAKQASEKSGLTGDKSELSKWLKKPTRTLMVLSGKVTIFCLPEKPCCLLLWIIMRRSLANIP